MVAAHADVLLVMSFLGVNQTSQLGLTIDIATGAGGFRLNFWAGTGR